jgi:hypothetical protein
MFRNVWNISPKETFLTWVAQLSRTVPVDPGFLNDKAAAFGGTTNETLRTTTITKLSPITNACYMANCWRCIYISLVTIGAGATFCCSKWERGKSKACRSCCDQVRDLDNGRSTTIMWTACTNHSSNHAHCCELGKPTQHIYVLCWWETMRHSGRFLYNSIKVQKWHVRRTLYVFITKIVTVKCQ